MKKILLILTLCVIVVALVACLPENAGDTDTIDTTDNYDATVEPSSAPDTDSDSASEQISTTDTTRGDTSKQSSATSVITTNPGKETVITTVSTSADTDPSVSIDTEAPETSDTEAPETSNTEAPETSDTEPPETSDTEAPETSDTEAPETSDTEAPETSDTEAPETSDTEAPETSDTEAPETSDTEPPELWPEEDIVDVMGVSIPKFTGKCDAIELTLLSTNIINPGVRVDVYKVSTADVAAYKNKLLDEGYIDGEGLYFLMVRGGMLCVGVTENSGNMAIETNLFKNSGSISQWPSDDIDENAKSELDLPVMRASSFELDLDVREISGVEVRSAVVACYGSSSSAAEDFRRELLAQGYEPSGGVYHKMTAEASISVSIEDTSYYAPNSYMITVAVTDNFTINHRTPTNIKMVYNDSELRYTAIKIGKDYMLTVDDGKNVTAYFYKYDAVAKRWIEYSAYNGSKWSLTDVVFNDSLKLEEKVFGFAVDSNMIIFTYDKEVKAYCGITAKQYIYKYGEGMTIYKLQHPESGLILEVGVIELDIATSCVTSYTTDVTDFGIEVPR